MKVAATIARYLLGLMFAVFGLNGFLHFIPQPPPTSPLALQYLTVMVTSHYFAVIAAIQLISGLLLLAGFFVPLALTLLGPVLFNILVYHSLMDPSGIGAGAFATLLWFIVFARYRASFAGVFEARPVTATAAPALRASLATE